MLSPNDREEEEEEDDDDGVPQLCKRKRFLKNQATRHMLLAITEDLRMYFDSLRNSQLINKNLKVTQMSAATIRIGSTLSRIF